MTTCHSFHSGPGRRAVLLAVAVLGVAGIAGAQNQVSGTFTVKTATTKFAYAYTYWKPNFFDQAATFVRVDFATNGSPRVATYQITAPGGLLVASGILGERQDEALVSLVAWGFQPLKVVQEGAWIAILARRRP